MEHLINKPTILLEDSFFKQKTIFISGSAYSYGEISKEKAEKFIYNLSQLLIKNGKRIVSGFGLGVGSYIISGALEEIYQNQGLLLHDQLILRPFPQGENGKKQWETYRNDMISYAGFAIFIFGNKKLDSKIVLADGIRREFDIAKEKRLKLIPIGGTGFMAKELWEEMQKNFDNYYPESDTTFKNLFDSLGNTKTDLSAHLETVIKLINMTIF